MPRGRSEKSIEAEKRYRAGEKLVDIAKVLDVPEGTVRRWKSDQDWEGKKNSPGTKKQSERSETKTNDKPNARNKKGVLDDVAPVDNLISNAIEENDELTQQQKDFCLYFMRNRNATQAYLKSHNCSYATANTEGPAALVNPRIKAELKRLREIKNAALGDLCGEDLVELHMRIAFADITDFVEFKNKRVLTMHNGKPIHITNPDTGEETMISHSENEIRLRDSSTVDGLLLSEVSESQGGAKIKLVNREPSLRFLERYFDMNPMDRHRKEYDQRRLDLELMRVEAEQQVQGDEADSPTSNFLDAMMGVAEDVWRDYEKSDENTPPDGE